MALDAEFVVRSQSGERVIPAADWFEGYLATARRPDEILVEVRFPAAAPGTGVSFQEVARRHGDFAMVGLAVSAHACRAARSATPGWPFPASPTCRSGPLRRKPSCSARSRRTQLFEEAARRATADIDPPADLHGSAEYRKKVAAALVRRGLRAAADSAPHTDNAHERQ